MKGTYRTAIQTTQLPLYFNSDYSNVCACHYTCCNNCIIPLASACALKQ